MREILFRAQAINRDKGEHTTNYKNGEWVYGLITRLYDERFPNLPAEMSDEDGVTEIEVDYKTIGQYIGVTDKNDKKIFEGDVIDTPDRLCEVYWFEKNAQFDLRFIRNAHNKRIINFKGIAMRDLSNYEIIGNIYDNPELLKSDTE